VAAQKLRYTANRGIAQKKRAQRARRSAKQRRENILRQVFLGAPIVRSSPFLELRSYDDEVQHQILRARRTDPAAGVSEKNAVTIEAADSHGGDGAAQLADKAGPVPAMEKEGTTLCADAVHIPDKHLFHDAWDLKSLKKVYSPPTSPLRPSSSSLSTPSFGEKKTGDADAQSSTHRLIVSPEMRALQIALTERDSDAKHSVRQVGQIKRNRRYTRSRSEIISEDTDLSIGLESRGGENSMPRHRWLIECQRAGVMQIPLYRVKEGNLKLSHVHLGEGYSLALARTMKSLQTVHSINHVNVCDCSLDDAGIARIILSLVSQANVLSIDASENAAGQLTATALSHLFRCQLLLVARLCRQ
jgi:hypothetical protein